jgi:hypothetical protein
MCLSEIKARQSAKIRQLAEAAKLTGLHTLDELASALGIPRSTAWTTGGGRCVESLPFASAFGTRFPGGVPRSDKYHKPKRADRRYVTTGPK